MTHRRFIFHFQKALQTAGYFLTFSGGRMEYLRLMKLLYLTDRECLTEKNQTITGDHLSALLQGPVLSTVLGLIQDKDSQSERWEHYIKRGKNYSFTLLIIRERTNYVDLKRKLSSRFLSDTRIRHPRLR